MNILCSECNHPLSVHRCPEPVTVAVPETATAPDGSAEARGSALPVNEAINCAIADMVNDFLRWPLPEDVAADGCATRPGKGRVGTNLLTCPETCMMMQAVVRPRLERLLRDLGVPNARIRDESPRQ